MKRKPAEIRVSQLVNEFLTQIGVSLSRKVTLNTTGEGTVCGNVHGVIEFDLDISSFLMMTEDDKGKQSHSGAA